jgi:putative membrane protein insertion efficiency factor
VSKIFSMLLISVVRLYQLIMSPLIGKSCRHIPTCSAYCIEAIKRFGPLKGGWLTVKRVSKCNPWSTSGYDPVPGLKVDDAS